MSVTEQRDAPPFAQNFAGTNLEQLRFVGQRRADTRAARITERYGPDSCAIAVCNMCTSCASSRGAIRVMFGSGRM